MKVQRRKKKTFDLNSVYNQHNMHFVIALLRKNTENIDRKRNGTCCLNEINFYSEKFFF